MSNIATVRLTSGSSIIETRPLYQYDYGQVLKFVGVDLPGTYEVHFANSPCGESTTTLGTPDGVAVPDIYLTTGMPVHAWVYLHSGEDDGETVYHVMIPVIPRPEVTGREPTPVEQDTITQTIAALNAGVEHVDEVADGIGETINAALAEAKESGEFDGEPGRVQDVLVNGVSILGDGVVADIDLASKADKADTVLDTTLSRGRKAESVIGPASFAFGENVEAIGANSHAEGRNTRAEKSDSHAEGKGTVAGGQGAHAEGENTTANGNYAHAEGSGVRANGNRSHAEGSGTSVQTEATAGHAEGYNTNVTGPYAHAEGNVTLASGDSSHAEGQGSKATAMRSHAEGYYSTASGAYSHSEGDNTTASSGSAHAEGHYSFADGSYGHAEGDHTRASGLGSHAEGYYSTASGAYSHSEGNNSKATNNDTHAEGYYTEATGQSTHAEGNQTKAYGQNSHTEGYFTTVEGYAESGHAEGKYTKVTAPGGHAEGNYTIASGSYAHAEGHGEPYTYSGTTITPAASGYAAHTEGQQTRASGTAAHAEGYQTNASGYIAHAEGYQTVAAGPFSHAEGQYSEATGEQAHAEGVNTRATGLYSHTEGNNTTASNRSAHAEGCYTTASGAYSHAEGNSGTTASGDNSHAEGLQTKASGYCSHAEGMMAESTGTGTHAEGYYTKAEVAYSHAEGSNTAASAAYAHAEGYYTTASGTYSHAEGSYTSTSVSAASSHAEGYRSTTEGYCSHAEGYQTKATGSYAHVEGYYTEATSNFSHVSGMYNVPDSYDSWPEWEANTHYNVGDRVKRTISSGQSVSRYAYICTTENADATFNSSKWQNVSGRMAFAEIVGNGNNDENRSNARALDWTGNAFYKGDVFVNCDSNSTNGSRLLSEAVKGVANGVASLDGNGKVPAAQLPSYVDDVTEYEDLAHFPEEGESGKIYIALDTNKAYRWSGSTYIEISTVDITSKADKADTVLDTTLSRGRRTGSVVGIGSFAFGTNVAASGYLANATGYDTTASGSYSHTEGSGTTASEQNAHAEGSYTRATNYNTHAEGYYTEATGSTSHAEGYFARATGNTAHAEGQQTTASGSAAHAEGNYATASGDNSHSEGSYTTASGFAAHAEGSSSNARTSYSHAEGLSTATDGMAAHSEGIQTAAIGQASHAEGIETIAVGIYSHVSGMYNVPDSYDSWPEWEANTHYNVGDKVKRTTGSGQDVTVYGYICNTENTDSEFMWQHWDGAMMNFAEIVGGGTDDSDRKNIRTLDWDGNARYAGDVYVGCNSDGTGGTKLASVDDISVTDVQINGTSVLDENGIADIPTASTSIYGAVMFNSMGLNVNNGVPYISKATDAQIKAGTRIYDPIVPYSQHRAVYFGLAKLAGADMASLNNLVLGKYPAEQKSAISTMFNAPIAVSGTTPTITGLAGLRYECGEVATLTITPPETGDIEVIFTSGSTPTVLTVPNTVKFPAWFDYMDLEANTTYDMIITNGTLGVVTSWV